MAHCKYCGETIEWGLSGERYVSLVPIGEEPAKIFRRFSDENGNLRAVHKDICKAPSGSSAIELTPIKPVKVKG